jgi:pyruvoyl-dependent arginine decarboxylase (PvlArgDC)
MAVDLNQVAEDMFKMVEEVHGVKKYKPGDVLKAMVKKYKDEGLTKKDAKAAIRILIDSERLVYTYFNGSWVELPGVEGAAKAAEEAANK